MSTPIFFYADLVGSATTVTASSEATGFEVESLDVLTPQIRWRATGDTSVTVTLDLGAATATTGCALVGHNFTSGATITIRGSTDNFSASDVLVATLTYRAAVIFGTWNSASYRYWRLVIADAANTDTYVELGRWLLGEHFTPNRGFIPGGGEGEEDLSVISQSLNGVETGLTRPRRRVRFRTFPSFTVTEHNDWVSMRDTCGSSVPLVVAWDSTNTPADTWYCRFVSPLSMSLRYDARDGTNLTEDVTVSVREML